MVGLRAGTLAMSSTECTTAFTPYSAAVLTSIADIRRVQPLVSRALPAQGFTVLSAKLGYKPKNPVDPASLSAEQLEEVEAFLAAIDANDDVQNVYVGLAG